MIGLYRKHQLSKKSTISDGLFNSDINSPALTFGSLCLIVLRIKIVHWTIFILLDGRSGCANYELHLYYLFFSTQ